jgi:predicted nucleic acid-binding protein
MSSDQFLDTNVLIYAFSLDAKAAKAEELLGRRCTVGIQGLNEFANVARRKLGMSWPDVRDALASIRKLCPTIAPMTLQTHSVGLELAERYRLATFDGLMAAAALLTGCTALWSEDMQHGLLIDGSLRIIDPFRLC